MQVTLVQEASTLDPAANRARLAELTPEGSDLVVFPEAFARDFGEAGSDVSPFAESLHGAFATELAAVAAEHNTTVVAGMFETSADPARPYNTLLVRGATDASYRKIHLYDSFGYRESDALSPGDLAHQVRSEQAVRDVRVLRSKCGGQRGRAAMRAQEPALVVRVRECLR